MHMFGATGLTVEGGHVQPSLADLIGAKEVNRFGPGVGSAESGFVKRNNRHLAEQSQA